MGNIDAIFVVMIDTETRSGTTRSWRGLYSESEGILDPVDRDPGELVTEEHVIFPNGRRAMVCPACHQHVLQEVRVHDPGTGEYEDAVLCTNHPNCPGLEV